MTATATKTLRPLIFGDLANFPDDGKRREIISGELLVSPAQVPTHQLVSMRLGLLIGGFVLTNELGFAFTAPIDVRLTPNDIVEPDLVYVSTERSSTIVGRFVDGAPELVVEILSPSTRQTDLVRKRALYADSGILEYWIVDPVHKSVNILQLSGTLYRQVDPERGTLRSPVLVGLEFDSATLFMDIAKLPDAE
jgi:Uma2 family endonuclease